jgi:hypothetical protein
MSLIEQAAKRLEQLRKAGVEVYSPAVGGEAPAPDASIPTQPPARMAPGRP